MPEHRRLAAHLMTNTLMKQTTHTAGEASALGAQVPRPR